MEFISLLICLALERWTDVGKTFRRYNLVDGYIQLIQKLFQRFEFQGYIGLGLFLAPLVLIVGILYIILSHISFGLFAWVFEIITLLYCLQPFDFCHQEHEVLIDGVDEEKKDIASIFIAADKNIFSVIFWFIILGPVGAILYRVNQILTYHAKTSDLSISALQLQAFFEWVPVRLETLSYALVSHFIDVMGVWSKYVLKGFDANDQLLTECGYAALHKNDQSTVDDCVLAKRIIERGLIIWLVIIALTILV